MSVEHTSRVWKQAKQNGAKLLLLLAIADFANANGVAFPSVSTLAKMTRTDERHIRRRLNELTSSGDLAIYRRRRRTSFYIVRVGQSEEEFSEAIAAIASATGAAEKEIRIALDNAKKASGGQIAPTPWPNSPHHPGQIAPTTLAILPPDPSINHQYNPSERNTKELRRSDERRGDEEQFAVGSTVFYTANNNGRLEVLEAKVVGHTAKMVKIDTGGRVRTVKPSSLRAERTTPKRKLNPLQAVIAERSFGLPADAVPHKSVAVLISEASAALQAFAGEKLPNGDVALTPFYLREAYSWWRDHEKLSAPKRTDGVVSMFGKYIEFMRKDMRVATARARTHEEENAYAALQALKLLEMEKKDE